jgi:hypothetical protein
MGYGMDGRVSIPDRGKVFPLLYNVQTVLEAHPHFYSVGTRGYFSGVKAAGA